jgi:hypothetical protein
MALTGIKGVQELDLRVLARGCLSPQEAPT